MARPATRRGEAGAGQSRAEFQGVLKCSRGHAARGQVDGDNSAYRRGGGPTPSGVASLKH